MAHGGGQKAVIAALAANVGIAVAKFAAFAFTGSGSMLAEGVHSVADSGNQALLLLGGKRSRRAADDTHQLGYGRERYFWSFVVALVLFSLGGAFALYEGIQKFRHPHEVESLIWAVGVLSVAIVLEGLSFRTAVIESNHVRGDASWATFIRRAKVPELPVVLLEDAGALIGLMLAQIAVITTAITGDPRYDALGTIAIGTLLSIIAVVLAIEMKSLLIGEAASRADQDAIQAAVIGSSKVLHLINVRTEHIGPDEILVAVKVEFDHDLEVVDLAIAVDEVESAVRAAVPAVDLIFVEPDIRRPSSPL